jgi:hypothetical protein
MFPRAYIEKSDVDAKNGNGGRQVNGFLPALCDAQSVRASVAGSSWASIDRYFVIPNFKAAKRLAHRLARLQNGVVIGGALHNR